MAVSVLQTRYPGDATLEDCIKMLDDSITRNAYDFAFVAPAPSRRGGPELGLAAGSWKASENAAASTSTWIFSTEPCRLPEATELVLFRVITGELDQRAPSFRCQASRCQHADRSGNEVILRVRDYGRGMSPAVLQKSSARRFRRRGWPGRHDRAHSGNWGQTRNPLERHGHRNRRPSAGPRRSVAGRIFRPKCKRCKDELVRPGRFWLGSVIRAVSVAAGACSVRIVPRRSSRRNPFRI